MSKLTIQKRETRGRKPAAAKPTPAAFNPASIQIFRGSELHFDPSILVPMRTDTMMDDILSTNRGLMPATNMIICGGPGSGKTTLVLDLLAELTEQGYNCLFVSGEMDEIGHYKYCRRMPKFATVPTLFIKNYANNLKEAMEHAFKVGYDVIAIDSVAEIVDIYREAYHTTSGSAETWLLDLQTQHKRGENDGAKYTSFVNIQQVTKGGEFAGSNRLKHMTDSMCHVTREKDGDSRKVQFSKNRDCDTISFIKFRIAFNQVEYSLPDADDMEE